MTRGAPSLPDAPRLDHIDGLRAVAVGLVVWFHARLPGLPNGFLGVDVFFVISGFLIPTQIIDRAGKGTFSVADFYARRIMRIAPPLLLVILTVLALTASLALLPSDMKRIAWSAASSLGLSANFYFLNGAGYFEVASEREPLLHLWSLAVEEQFYLMAPAAILAMAAFARGSQHRLVRIAILCAAALLVISLGAGLPFARTKPTSVFYLTPLRAWEFAAGTLAALALHEGWKVSEIPGRLLALAGLAAIALACCVPAANPLLRLALQILSVAGAAAVLYGGGCANRGFGLALLRFPPVVGIGLISYSLYLWHWPLLSFWRLTHLDAPTPVQNLTFGIAIPALLAILTYVAVERPLRRARRHALRTDRRRRVLVAGIAASAVLALVAIATVGWAKALRGDDRYRPFEEASRPIMPACRPGVRGPVSLPGCHLGSGHPTRVLLWGDSHAHSLSDAVAATANEVHRGADLQWDGGCPPIVGRPVFVGGKLWINCIGRNNEVAAWLASPRDGWPQVTGVVLAGNWSAYPRDHVAPETTRPEALRMMTEAVRTTLGRLHDLGLRVLVFGPAPTFTLPVVDCLWLSQPNTERCDQPRTSFDIIQGETVAALRSAAVGLDNVRVVDQGEAFCDRSVCVSSRGDAIYYSDTNHLSRAGALAVHDRFADDLRWVFAAPARSKVTAE